MKSEKRFRKRVVLGILLIGIIVISIGFVSASWKDWFGFGEDNKDLEGELAESAKAQVIVSPSSTPPEIVFVSNVNDTLIAAEASEYVSFSYLAWSIAGTGYLPPGGSSVAKGSVNYTTTFIYDTNDCTKAGEVDGAAYGKAGSMLSNYSCEVLMYYYSEPAPNFWGINATVVDDGGNKASNFSRLFQLQQNGAFKLQPTPTSVNWTNIQLNASPASAANEIKAINTGNRNIGMAYNPLSINASYLNGSATPSEIIPSNKFGVADVVTCSPGSIGQSLTESQKISVNPFNILYTSSAPTIPANNNLTFCLDTISGISPQTYTLRTGRNWELEISWIV